ncbi:PREDICTED: LOW QUALITY PROTEIN: transcription initiation factor TFIID subunit 5-like [Polistes dominula]|uniref:LOW QUALITY PROTEIN: transcription initiation factor TFIID subunit 5-like n=1 Tax=Polistes dominula TaxID=743375 RepID=A0ABM1JAB1_POLDO|nr:PREDICTED: LOW QUALITY PROTEIN: transcription initiation factor TFIID subunit 5-like [Polistes dominula]
MDDKPLEPQKREFQSPAASSTKYSSDSLESLYLKLKNWIEDSLDLFKNDLLPLFYPLFVHIYFDLIQQNKTEEAKAFFTKYSADHENKKEELKYFKSIYTPQHIHENNLAYTFRTSKYYLPIGRYAFDLLINFLEENNFTYILKVLNQYLNINIYTGTKNEDKPQGIDDCEVDLTTFLASKECEEAILADEQYKYDHLEAYAIQLKKQREAKDRDSTIKPNASQIISEIKKLKDLCKRVSVNKNNLPSICCYTIHNTYEGLTAAEISTDSKLLACGFKDSFRDIFSLTKEPLRRLKKSSDLAKTDIKNLDKEKFEEVGSTYRLIGHSGPVYCVKFFSSNKFLLSCSQDCTVRLWSLDLLTQIGVYKSHVFPIWCVDVAPNDFYFASGPANRQTVVWSVTGQKPERLFVTSLSDVTSIKFHPNSKYLFTGSSDHKISMHDISNAQLVRTFHGHTDAVTCLDISHCRKLLVSGSKDKTLILWDIQNGKSLIKYIGHDNVIFSVSFSWYGTIIASCDADNCVRLWDKTDQKGFCLGIFYTKNTPLYCIKFGYRNIISTTGPFMGA